MATAVNGPPERKPELLNHVGDALDQELHGLGEIVAQGEPGLDAARQAAAGVIDGRSCQCLLAVGKVVVERTFGRTAFGHDLVQAGGVVALGLQQIAGCLDDVLADCACSGSCHAGNYNDRSN